MVVRTRQALLRQEEKSYFVTEGFIARMNPDSTVAERLSTEPYVGLWPTVQIRLGTMDYANYVRPARIVPTVPAPSIRVPNPVYTHTSSCSTF